MHVSTTKHNISLGRAIEWATPTSLVKKWSRYVEIGLVLIEKQSINQSINANDSARHSGPEPISLHPQAYIHFL